MERLRLRSMFKPLQHSGVECFYKFPVTSRLNLFVSENIYVTGSVDALVDWSPDNALILSAATYPVWSSKLQAYHDTNLCTHLFPTQSLSTYRPAPRSSINIFGSSTVPLHGSRTLTGDSQLRPLVRLLSMIHGSD